MIRPLPVRTLRGGESRRGQKYDPVVVPGKRNVDGKSVG